MNYGDYRYVLPYPDIVSRNSLDEYNKKIREMNDWLHEQKWDHWGAGVCVGGYEFWFYNEENYNWFVLRWS